MGAVTQEMGSAREIGDRVLFMDDCIVVENDTSQEIFLNVRNERIVSPLSKVCNAVFNLIFLFFKNSNLLTRTSISFHKFYVIVSLNYAYCYRG